MSNVFMNYQPELRGSNNNNRIKILNKYKSKYIVKMPKMNNMVEIMFK